MRSYQPIMVVDAHPRPQQRNWIPNRRFNTRQRYGDGIDPTAVELRYDELWTHVARERPAPCRNQQWVHAYPDRIVIAVDGACRNNGNATARASAGVFVGDDSEYNCSYTIRLSDPTNQKAELIAGIKGLETALCIEEDGINGWPLKQVVIKTDSTYFADGMTNWIFAWKGNGYRTADGRPVANKGLFAQANDLVTSLNNLDVEVLFWHVRREFNRDADRLANLGLAAGRNRN